MPPLELDAAQTAQVAELAPVLEGKPDVTKINRIELERLAREFRTQRIVFETARDVFDQMKHTWQGSREMLLAQLVRLVERFIASDRIAISPPLFYQDDCAGGSSSRSTCRGSCSTSGKRSGRRTPSA